MGQVEEEDGEEEGEGEVQLAEDGTEDGELSEKGGREDGSAEDVDVESTCNIVSAIYYIAARGHRDRIRRSSLVSGNVATLKMDREGVKLRAYHRWSPRSSVRRVRPRGET